MLVGLVGPPFAGKSTLAAYLKANHNFEIINIGNCEQMNEFGLLD